MPSRNASSAVARSSRQDDASRRFFTVDEANRALPYVTRITDDIVHTYDSVVQLRRRLERAVGEAAGQLEREYETAMDRLSDLVDELHAVGVELKDFEHGLVDFPAVYDGREIWLCWRLGEEHVEHWHELEAGAAGRQPVERLEQ